ncbi:MAG: VOC family protein [Sphingomonadaceae bacterium]|nr:VOC family protein [Sphingomonadaceae bacterium]
MSVNPIPEGYHSVTPYLAIDGAAEAIDWYVKAFGATEELRFERDGKIGHAEIKIGDSHVMLADEFAEMDHLGPKSRGGATASFMIYLPDVDAAFQRAIDAGATETRPVKDQFYGDRSGTLADPFGHVWTLATHVEELSEEEMMKRAQEERAEA